MALRRLPDYDAGNVHTPSLIIKSSHTTGFDIDGRESTQVMERGTGGISSILQVSTD